MGQQQVGRIIRFEMTLFKSTALLEICRVIKQAFIRVQNIRCALADLFCDLFKSIRRQHIVVIHEGDEITCCSVDAMAGCSGYTDTGFK